MTTTHTRIDDVSGEHGLSFDCGDLPADAAVIARGQEPNGRFWESVAEFVAPDVVARLELDSEGSMFTVWGQPEDLRRLQQLMEPLVSSPGAVESVLRQADERGHVLID